MLKTVPIGRDDFREVREMDSYYVDKSMMIKDFLEYRDKVALVTRPRRFGKTLNMTMIREFFDITTDSKKIFEGLKIMDTEYADQINSRPVIYFTFKECTGKTSEDLRLKILEEISKQYSKYFNIFDGKVNKDDFIFIRFYQIYQKLADRTIDFSFLAYSIEYLIKVVDSFYKITPIVLIDEYDQPILSSYENGYKDELQDFFSTFYGSALKGQQCMSQALLTGIQRVAKESIFSKLNNFIVYTTLNKEYSEYFGLTTEETKELLEYYGLELNKEVKNRYDGYIFGGLEIYNPWSILNYVKLKELNNYWINTSTNSLIKDAFKSADKDFKEKFEKLVENKEVEVGANLEASFIELQSTYTLWGLLVNSGYLTIVKKGTGRLRTVRIPNEEVKSEFGSLVAQYTKVGNESLEEMFSFLMDQNMEEFFNLYQKIVLDCTSYHDSRENAYHMLFLGMCISLDGIYKVTSNLESGHGRSDITLESKNPEVRPHMIFEFKQGENLEKLKQEALDQILNKKYYSNLKGKVICVGIAHDKKKCELAYKTVE